MAQEKADFLESLVDPELVLAANSSALGVDLSKGVADMETVADARGSQGMQGTFDRVKSTMRDKNMSFTEAVKSRGRDLVVGKPSDVADYLQDLVESHACDGFVVAPLVFPSSLEQFCRMIVPELQRRGVFRKEYRGRTLRENLRATPR
jgi:alkanesulfonate monooxygenase SsuD/methylene tetrahydromethanopterin reductase-like flavin-dependent oxidoreductase (luciferase family)